MYLLAEQRDWQTLAIRRDLLIQVQKKQSMALNFQEISIRERKYNMMKVTFSKLVRVSSAIEDYKHKLFLDSRGKRKVL